MYIKVARCVIRNPRVEASINLLPLNFVRELRFPVQFVTSRYRKRSAHRFKTCDLYECDDGLIARQKKYEEKEKYEMKKICHIHVYLSRLKHISRETIYETRRRMVSYYCQTRFSIAIIRSNKSRDELGLYWDIIYIIY